MCLCRSERTSFTNGNLKGSINAGRYTADYLQCGNLPYLAWKNAHNCAGLSYRRIRRYLVWRLKRLEARDFSRVRIKFLIHSRSNAQGKNHHSRYSAGHPVFKVTEMHHMLGFVHIRKFPGNTCIEAKSQISQSQKCPYQLQNCFSWKFSFLHLRRFPIKSLFLCQFILPHPKQSYLPCLWQPVQLKFFSCSDSSIFIILVISVSQYSCR